PIMDLVLIAHPVGASRVEELFPDRDDGVERREGGLKDHGAVRPTKPAQPLCVEGQNIERALAVVVPDLAFRHARAPWREPDEPDGERRLARTGSADDGQR